MIALRRVDSEHVKTISTGFKGTGYQHITTFQQSMLQKHTTTVLEI